MGATAKRTTSGLPDLYDHDLCAWAEANAALLRSGCLSAIDTAHLAEELEDMGKSERRSLRGHLRNLLLHLLKWQFQPARRSRSWQLSILNARIEIADILADSPSLAPELPGMLDAAYGAARQTAAVETRLAIGSLPIHCPYRIEELRDDTFWPQG